MTARAAETFELTYPLGAAARLTGLSPEVLRAWERRHAAVTPIRTVGGTRRYTAADLDRLRLLKQAVDAGNRIGKIAQLDADELRAKATDQSEVSGSQLEGVTRALERLDAEEVRDLLSTQLGRLGPARFARDFALPLVRDIGERWADGLMGIASEHLATVVLRSLLGSALQASERPRFGPKIVFATPTGEPHELGLQMAALNALAAGAIPVYLGAELPAEDVVYAVEKCEASVLALGLVTISPSRARRAVHAVRGALPQHTRVWLGGRGATGIELPPDVDVISDLDQLDYRVSVLLAEGSYAG